MENIKTECHKPDFERIKINLLNKNTKKVKITKSISDSKLFKTFLLNNIKLKNHFAFINLNDDIFYDSFGVPNNNFFKFYSNIAKNNIGLIITGGVFNQGKHNYETTSSSININSKKAIEKHSKTIQMVHSNGGKIFLQIKSIYGRGDFNNKAFDIFNYSASTNNAYNNSQLPCFRISDSKCRDVIESFGDIARFAQTSGYDGVLINGELDNIVGEFSSKEFNKRLFGYYANTCDLSVNILKNIKSKCKNINILYSITIDSFLVNLFENDLKSINSTRKINSKTEFFNMCEFLIKLINEGVDGFVFRFGTFENSFLKNYNQFEAEHIFFDYYKEISDYFDKLNIKNKFGKNVSIIYTDNITNLEKVSLYHDNGLFDLVDITKQIYSDNKFLLKTIKNSSIKPCIKCSFCNKMSSNNNLACLVNPNLFGDEFRPANSLNNHIAIVGAGISGIICANYLAQRGFVVDLFEKNDSINKNGRLSEVFKFDLLLSNFNDYLEFELEYNVKSNKVKLFLNQEFKLSHSKNEYRAVIVATGFYEKLLNVNGSILKNVKSIYDVLGDKNNFNSFDKILIYAKSELSLKLALYLLLQGKSVSVIIPSISELKNMSDDRYSYYFYQLKSLNAEVFINARVRKIETDFVEIVVNNKYSKHSFLAVALNLKSNSIYSYEPKVLNIDLDLFVYEPDLSENNKLYYELVVDGFQGELYMIGSALKVSDLSSDIKSAYFVAKNL